MEHDITVLIRGGLLQPLYKPMKNSRNYFARFYISQLVDDVTWLRKAHRAVSQNWKEKNASRKVASEMLRLPLVASALN